MYVEPLRPKEFTINKDKITEATITLSWKESNSSDVPIVGYEVQYRKRNEDFEKVEKYLTHEDLTYEITGLVARTEYQFRVAAINEAGCGNFTHAITQFTSESCSYIRMYVKLYTYTKDYVTCSVKPLFFEIQNVITL